MNLHFLMALLMYPVLIVQGGCPFYNCEKYFSTSLVCKNMSLGHTESCNYSVAYTKFNDIVLKNLNITYLEFDIFYQMTKLTSIYLSNNSLEVLDYRLFSKQKHLSRLDLNYNRLKYLDSRLFAKQKKLSHLDLSYNMLTYLDNSIFQNQSKITKLFLTGNHLTSLNSLILSPLKSLKNLQLSQNSFVCSCSIRDTMVWCVNKNLSTNATCDNGISWLEFNFTEVCPMNFTDIQASKIIFLEEELSLIISISVLFILICILTTIFLKLCKCTKSKSKDRYMTVGVKHQEKFSDFLIPPNVKITLK